jgi:DNA repair exonuclease SbcCD nuclease subunit
MILTADWHLTDNPDEEYRWDVFNRLAEFCQEVDDFEVYILGDLADRKDRHSAALVNKLIGCLQKLVSLGCTVDILMGNHDAPLQGTPFWSFLSNLKGVSFVTSPIFRHEVYLLPYTPDPVRDWAGLFDDRVYPLCFIHQPLSGARLNNGTLLDGEHPLPLPADAVVYAGDIHPPQKVKVNNITVTYVGAPHPIKFGDVYQCRMLQIDERGKILRKHILNPLRRHMIKITDWEEGGYIDPTNIKVGDHAKIEVSVHPDNIAYWPTIREGVEEWAREKGVRLFSVEAFVEFNKPAEGDRETIILDFPTDPEEILAAFAEAEGLPAKSYEWGHQTLKEELDDGA